MNPEQSTSNPSQVSDNTSPADRATSDHPQSAAETSEIGVTSSAEQSPPKPAGDPSGSDTVEIPVVTENAPPVEAVSAVSGETSPEKAEAVAAESSPQETQPPLGKSDQQVESGQQDGQPQSTEPVEAGTEPEAAPRSRPRVELNPTVDPLQAVAIPAPMLAPPLVPEVSESSDVNAAATAQAALPPAAPPSEPIELPPADAQLDLDVEAEIAAAMSVEETATASTPGESAPGSEPVTEEELEPGTKLKGRVQSIQKENILLDVGFRASAMVQLRQFEGRKQPQLGQELEIVIDRFDAEDGVLLASLPRMVRSAGNWDEVAVNQIVECVVKKSNKGGLEVSVSNLRGFMPASQVDLGYVSNLDEYVGQKLTVKIIELKPEKRNLVVSRRALLQDEREEVAEDLWKNLEAGQVHPGKVRTVKDYGAFVDIGGIDGLLHVGELSWTRVNHPRDVLSVGQELEVQVVSVDLEKKKVGLSLRRLTKNPWDDVVERFPIESVVNGKVTNIADFGAFVEIEEGVEGLVHISELDYRRINRVSDVLKTGDDVEAKVVSIDPAKKRIGLSIKALLAKPVVAAKPKDEDLAPGDGESYERKRKGPLKGGTGGSGGPLFG